MGCGHERVEYQGIADVLDGRVVGQVVGVAFHGLVVGHGVGRVVLGVRVVERGIGIALHLVELAEEGFLRARGVGPEVVSLGG